MAPAVHVGPLPRQPLRHASSPALPSPLHLSMRVKMQQHVEQRWPACLVGPQASRDARFTRFTRIRPSVKNC